MCVEQTSVLELVREGNALRLTDHWERAEAAYRRATLADPECSDAWAELGCLLADGRRFPEAVQCLGHALHLPAAPPEAEGSAQEAVRLLGRIAAARSGWSTGQLSLGCALEHLHDFETARFHFRSALNLDPAREAAVEAQVARTYMLEKRPVESIEAADRALLADPRYYLAHVIRSQSCLMLGRMAEAAESNRQAIRIAPGRALHSRLLFQMNYLAEITPEQLYEEASRWNTLYAAPRAARIQRHTNSADPDRPLRVGYVSSDLHNHPIMRFLLPVLERHNAEHFEVHAYAPHGKKDAWNQRVRQYVAGLQYIREPEQLAARVREDRIDILVDLGGHSMGPGLLAFAEKPAPIQISWMGVAATTGMPAIDYFLGDPCMPCPGTEHLFAEKIFRLPHASACYRPFRTDLPVRPAPSLERGYITFGSFNNPHKITREVVKLWSAILHLAPQSKLRLKYFGMNNSAVQDRFRLWFQEDGIAIERVEFEAESPAELYLNAYGSIDIALDPFPYHGGSTTLDALWMGVPVVTLAGRAGVQRAGVTVLTGAGLSDFVARTPEQYLKIALYLAAVVPKYAELRGEIRRALQASPWMDEAGLVRNLEDAYREMWRAWCRGPS
jgi:protein O-GlcNAc transferase